MKRKIKGIEWKCPECNNWYGEDLADGVTIIRVPRIICCFDNLEMVATFLLEEKEKS